MLCGAFRRYSGSRSGHGALACGSPAIQNDDIDDCIAATAREKASEGLHHECGEGKNTPAISPQPSAARSVKAKSSWSTVATIESSSCQ
jgi:hypothetical protein